MAVNLPESAPTGRGVGLRVEISRRGAAVTIGVAGELGLAEQDVMRAVVESELAFEPECLVLDLSRLSFMASTGIHLVLEIDRLSARQETRLSIIPGPKAVQRVFELCQLTERLQFTKAA